MTLTCETRLIHTLDLTQSRHTYEWVVSYIWVTESCKTWLIHDVWMSHMNESCFSSRDLHMWEETYICEKGCAKETYICEKRPTYVKIRNDAHETCKRDLNMWKEPYKYEKRHAKETYICEKRPTWVKKRNHAHKTCKRDLHMWKETYICEKGHAKETYTCEKKPTYVKRDVQKSPTYVKRDLHMWKLKSCTGEGQVHCQHGTVLHT